MRGGGKRNWGGAWVRGNATLVAWKTALIPLQLASSASLLVLSRSTELSVFNAWSLILDAEFSMLSDIEEKRQSNEKHSYSVPGFLHLVLQRLVHFRHPLQAPCDSTLDLPRPALILLHGGRYCCGHRGTARPARYRTRIRRRR